MTSISLFIPIVIQSLILYHFVCPQCIPLESTLSAPGSNSSHLLINQSRNQRPFIITEGDIAVHAVSSSSSSTTTTAAISSSPTKHGKGSSNVVLNKFQGQKPPEITTKVSQDNLWIDGMIPFEMHESVLDSVKISISSAIFHWESETCIRFRPKTPADESWITFRSDSVGCYSFVGRDDTCRGQGQPVSLSKGCHTFLVAAHEIGHAVGLRHQHNRPDRDHFVHINWNNLISGSSVYFRKDSYDTLGIPYDFTSLMQYTEWHFSKDVMNKSSMVTLDPVYQRFLGNGNGLSFRDKKFVNLLYNCTYHCPSNVKCLNEGYVSPTCNCVCPPNTSGSSCESVISEDYYYNDAAVHACGGFVTQEIIISTPDQDVNCVWIIQSSHPSESIRLTILEFSLHPRSDISRLSVLEEAPPNMKCVNESVVVRLHDPYDGRRFCERDLSPGDTLTSTSTRVVILVSSNVISSKSTFKAKVTFVNREREEQEEEASITSTSTTTNRTPTRAPSITASSTLSPGVNRPTTSWSPWSAIWSIYSLLPGVESLLGLFKNVRGILLAITRGSCCSNRNGSHYHHHHHPPLLLRYPPL